MKFTELKNRKNFLSKLQFSLFPINYGPKLGGQKERMNFTGIELKVVKALKNDVGKGIIRVGTVTRDELGIAGGDLIEIIGKRSTGAGVWRAYARDEGQGIVKMDKIIRHNAKVFPGDTVIIKNITVKEAKKVSISFPRYNFSAGITDFILRRVIGRPVVSGDVIMQRMLGTTLPILVCMTDPEGIVQITTSTN